MTSKAFGLVQLGNAYSDGALTNRNLIINGAMQVAQRGTSASSIANNVYSCLGRWVSEHAAAVWTLNASQATDAPSGFKYSSRMESQTTATASAGNYIIPFEHRIEAATLDQLAWGTVDARIEAATTPEALKLLTLDALLV